MDRVIELLQQDRFSEALVRLWVLAGNAALLNRWEQACDKSRMTLDVMAVRAMCNAPHLHLAKLASKPLALICALDELVAAERGIQHTINPTYDVDGKHYWLLPTCLENTSSLRKQVINRCRWFCHHLIIPAETSTEHRVQLHYSQGKEDEIFLALVQENTPVNIWIGHFDDSADVKWEDNSNAINNWRTEQVVPLDVRWQSLQRQLLVAKNAKAHLLVFPEFSIDVPLRKKIAHWLRRHAWDELVFLVPGSFHEQVDGGDFFNTAPLVCAASDVLFTHQKLKLFGNERVGAERVEIGDILHIVMTPLGLLTVMICKDFMDGDWRMANLLQEVPVNWVLVPSFGDDKTIRAHQQRAQALATIAPGANSAVANTVNTAGKDQHTVLEPLPGFGHRCAEKNAKTVALEGEVQTFPFQLKSKPAS